MSQRRTWRWIAFCLAVVAVAITAAWRVNLMTERNACDAKSSSELLRMAHDAANNATAEMGASPIDPLPLTIRYNPDQSTRVEFEFMTRGASPQKEEVRITRNCHVIVAWLGPLRPTALERAGETVTMAP